MYVLLRGHESFVVPLDSCVFAFALSGVLSCCVTASPWKSVRCLLPVSKGRSVPNVQRARLAGQNKGNAETSVRSSPSMLCCVFTVCFDFTRLILGLIVSVCVCVFL